MLPVFKAAAKTALALLGEGSFLRGDEPCKVRLQHGVQVEGLDGQASYDQAMVYTRTVAHIDSDMLPKTNDVLAHPEGQFVLEKKFLDSGAKQVWIVRKNG